MAITVRFDAASTIAYTDPQGIVPASATAQLVTAAGTVTTLCGSVTLPTCSTTVGLVASVTPGTCTVSDLISAPDPTASTFDVDQAAMFFAGDATPMYPTGVFDSAWLKTGEEAPQYRQVLTSVSSFAFGQTAVVMTLGSTLPAPFDAWQTGTPASNTTLELYATAALTFDVPVLGASGSTKQQIRVLDATGIRPGEQLRVQAGGVCSVVTVERVQDLTIQISPALDQIPPDGSAVAGLRMTCTLAAPTAALLGTGHRILWTYTDADGATRQHVEAVQVVRWVPDQAISGADVRAIVAAVQTTSAASKSQAYYDAVAARVARRIEQALDATGRRQALYGDPNAFSEAARTCARLYLADDGIFPPQMQPDQYLKSLDIRLENELRLAVAGLAFDQDGDGKLAGEELAPRFFSFRVRL